MKAIFTEITIVLTNKGALLNLGQIFASWPASQMTIFGSPQAVSAGSMATMDSTWPSLTTSEIRMSPLDLLSSYASSIDIQSPLSSREDLQHGFPESSSLHVHIPRPAVSQSTDRLSLPKTSGSWTAESREPSSSSTNLTRATEDFSVQRSLGWSLYCDESYNDAQWDESWMDDIKFTDQFVWPEDV